MGLTRVANGVVVIVVALLVFPAVADAVLAVD
jgi:hypothetical protein